MSGVRYRVDELFVESGAAHFGGHTLPRLRPSTWHAPSPFRRRGRLSSRRFTKKRLPGAVNGVESDFFDLHKGGEEGGVARPARKTPPRGNIRR